MSLINPPLKKTFSRDERLRSRRLIQTLFKTGKNINESPFRIKWMFLAHAQEMPVQVMMSVPKYNFKKAVTRNLIRRRMKEAFRLNKENLCASLISANRYLALSITYSAKEILPFEFIQQKIILILHRLMVENEKVTG